MRPAILVSASAGFLTALACISTTWATDPYRLGPRDVVRVTVYNNPDLTTEAQLDAHGKIVFPLIGPIDLGGLEKGAAESKITNALVKGSYVKEPQVNLFVAQFRSRQVSILGHVQKPGYYALDALSRLADVLALAGGINTTGADLVTVIKNDAAGGQTRVEVDSNRMLREGDLKQNLVIEDGDVIYVPRAEVFYIHGEVHKPGAYRLERDMTVMQAISVGGGITPRGSERRVQLHRPEGDGKVKKSDAKLLDRVKANDVVYVKEALF